MIKKMKALMIEFSTFSSLLEKNSNDIKTFIIIFESMKNFESMIIDLINKSFSHYLIDFRTDMNDQSLINRNFDHLQIVRVLPFWSLLSRNEVKLDKKRTSEQSHKSLFCTRNFLLFFLKSIFLVINIS